jgi:hypothetical protein
MELVSTRRWAVRWGKHMVFATAVVSALAADIIYRSSAYSQGYKTFESPPSILVVLWFFIAVVACSLIAIASAAFLFVSAWSAARRRQIDFAPFLIILVLFVALFANTRHSSYYFVKGMRDWVSERPSMVQEIEEWFRTLGNDKSLSKTKGYLIDPALSPGEQVIKAEWPPCVKRLCPACVTLANVHGAWKGEVGCGGGVLAWGLVICDSQKAVASQVYGYMMKVGPTSYVYVEAPESRLFVE